MEGKVKVEIDVKDYGIIKLELDADNKTITIKEEFYKEWKQLKEQAFQEM